MMRFRRWWARPMIVALLLAVSVGAARRADSSRALDTAPSIEDHLAMMDVAICPGCPDRELPSHAGDGRRERLASSRPAHRLDDDVEELASFCKGAALACGTGANPRQPVDPDLDALDIAKLFK